MEEEEEAAQLKEKQRLAGLAKYRKRNLQQKNYEETLSIKAQRKLREKDLFEYNNTKNEIENENEENFVSSSASSAISILKEEGNALKTMEMVFDDQHEQAVIKMQSIARRRQSTVRVDKIRLSIIDNEMQEKKEEKEAEEKKKNEEKKENVAKRNQEKEDGEIEQAVICIQSTMRSKKSRQRVGHMRQERKASLKIQAIQRGNQGRQKVKHLQQQKQKQKQQQMVQEEERRTKIEKEKKEKEFLLNTTDATVQENNNDNDEADEDYGDTFEEEDATNQATPMKKKKDPNDPLEHSLTESELSIPTKGSPIKNGTWNTKNKKIKKKKKEKKIKK